MTHRFAAVLYYALFAAFGAVALLLIGSVIPVAGYQARIIATGSMAPTMPMGSAVFIRAAGSYVQGDVITFQRPGEKMPTTHRIVSESTEGGVTSYTVRGDANNADDMRPVPQGAVLGKVFLAVPYLGFIIDFLRKPLGFVALVGIPAMLVVVEEGQKMYAAMREKRAAQEANV